MVGLRADCGWSVCPLSLEVERRFLCKYCRIAACFNVLFEHAAQLAIVFIVAHIFNATI